MKKVLIFLFLISICLMAKTNENDIVIPKEAIRYRIIANSNTLEDQMQKMMINTEIEPILAEVLINSNDINESRLNINNNIPTIKKVINKYGIPYDINYGLNYFPEKTYKGITYEEGNYESLVITLGDGLGDNWWCVLFPPLCLLEASENELDEAEYSLYIKDIIASFS